jgi:hypothetical protein
MPKSKMKKVEKLAPYMGDKRSPYFTMIAGIPLVKGIVVTKITNLVDPYLSVRSLRCHS